MSKCPTEGCDEMLATHSRRKYCRKCRAMMRNWAIRRPAEVLEYRTRLTKAAFRITHIEERKLDQTQALSQLRQSKRKGRNK